MTKFKKVLILISIALSGCGNLNSIYRPLNMSEGSGALIDIKQRGILASVHESQSVDPQNKNLVKIKITRFCAEPSPDALSAYALELAAKAELPDKTAAQLSLASQEGSSFVGLRTQSIQIMRDSMYRICEAYASGGITADQFNTMLLRSQKMMVTLLAIEQITGTLQAPSVVINTRGEASSARPVTEMREEVKKIKKQIDALNSEKDKAGVSSDEKAELEKDIEALKGDEALIEDAMKAPGGLKSAGRTEAKVIVNALPSRLTGVEIKEIAEVVRSMVKDVAGMDDTGALCFAYLKNKEDAKDTSLYKFCDAYLQAKLHELVKLIELNQQAVATENQSSVQDDSKKPASVKQPKPTDNSRPPASVDDSKEPASTSPLRNIPEPRLNRPIIEDMKNIM